MSDYIYRNESQNYWYRMQKYNFFFLIFFSSFVAFLTSRNTSTCPSFPPKPSRCPGTWSWCRATGPTSSSTWTPSCCWPEVRLSSRPEKTFTFLTFTRCCDVSIFTVSAFEISKISIFLLTTEFFVSLIILNWNIREYQNFIFIH